eukprot:TRINITY_DN2569_c0_g1_i1.p1 TRINITY_DN2569_c0_g1~~TRINITY_DN2569_c0_g1_i1.p1  ORF type:complete len:141 (-),score=52.15 TRINITY_DN2569_c0_g1_i1:509-931(-)
MVLTNFWWMGFPIVFGLLSIFGAARRNQLILEIYAKLSWLIQMTTLAIVVTEMLNINGITQLCINGYCQSTDLHLPTEVTSQVVQTNNEQHFISVGLNIALMVFLALNMGFVNSLIEVLKKRITAVPADEDAFRAMKEVR